MSVNYPFYFVCLICVFFMWDDFFVFFFFFNDTATTEIYTLSLHDALPIWDNRPAQRPSPRYWWIPDPATCDYEMGFRREGRRCLLVYSRHRLGNRPLLHRLRPTNGRNDRANV